MTNDMVILLEFISIIVFVFVGLYLLNKHFPLYKNMKVEVYATYNEYMMYENGELFVFPEQNNFVDIYKLKDLMMIYDSNNESIKNYYRRRIKVKQLDVKPSSIGGIKIKFLLRVNF